MSRKNTPDIMANLMGTAILDKDFKSDKAVKHERDPMENVQKALPEQIDHKAIKQASNNNELEALKEKTTFNLSSVCRESLEDTWVRWKKKLKGEQRITKTLIVEKAIELAIADLESKSELGDMYALLTNKRLKS